MQSDSDIKTGLWVKGSPVFDREAGITPIVTIHWRIGLPLSQRERAE
jgi:hypothetical protein